MAVTLQKYISAGQTYPKWYGVAWIDYCANRAVCYPIPLNILIRAGRFLWLFCGLPFGHAGVRVERWLVMRAAANDAGEKP